MATGMQIVLPLAHCHHPQTILESPRLCNYANALFCNYANALQNYAKCPAKFIQIALQNYAKCSAKLCKMLSMISIKNNSETSVVDLPRKGPGAFPFTIGRATVMLGTKLPKHHHPHSPMAVIQLAVELTARRSHVAIYVG